MAAVRTWTVADMESARESLHRGELTMTLTATEGERFRLRDIGKLCMDTEALMRATAKGVAPAEKIEWVLTAVGMAGNAFAISFTGRKPTARRRRRTTNP